MKKEIDYEVYRRRSSVIIALCLPLALFYLFQLFNGTIDLLRYGLEYENSFEVLMGYLAVGIGVVGAIVLYFRGHSTK